MLSIVVCLACVGMASLSAQEADTSPPTNKRVALPWRARGDQDKQPRPAISPQAMLKLLGIDEQAFATFQNDRDFNSEEDSTLTKILYRLPRFDPPQWDSWCVKAPDWSALRKQAAQHRGDCFRVAGRAQRVERIALPQQQAALLEFAHYYRVTLAVEGLRDPVVVFTRQIPVLWKQVAELDQPVVVQAMFLKLGAAQNDVQTYYFAAARLAWYPDQVNIELGATADRVWLAARGMDIALWDDVRKRSGTAVSAEEGECFYQLLAKLSQATPALIQQLPAQPFDLPGMLQHPDALLGQAYDGEGIARRIQKVSVPEAYRERLGLDHYYEIDLFIPLDNQAIRLSTNVDDEEAPIFTDGFPATFCVARLPENLSEGLDMKETVRLKGIFFKQWAYGSDYLQQFKKSLRQPSPLLMGLEPTLVPSESSFDTTWLSSSVLMVLIVSGIATLWLATWVMKRGDRNYKRQVLDRFQTKKILNSPEKGPAAESSDTPG